MELPYWFVPLVQLVAALLVMKAVVDRYRARRSANPVVEAEGAGGGWSSAPFPQSNLPDAPGFDAQHAAPVAAGRLARIRAAHDEDAAPFVPPAPQMAAAPRRARPEETVTAVLRRQVPVRDELPRSWLGGLPMMPEGVEWPRGVDAESRERLEIPLNFLAQIACEDLPADLWGGLGPRTGWLLFFINPNQGTAEDRDTYRVLYTRELGSERQPPSDCGPVHDKIYTGGSYNWLPAEDIPAFWRRWPVDIVAMPNALTLHEEEGSTWKTASPDNLSDILYADVPLSRTEFDGPMPRLRPLTFGQARAAVEGLARSLRAKTQPAVDDKARELLLAEGGHASLLAELEANRDRIAAISPALREPPRARQMAFLEAAIPALAAMDAAGVLAHTESIHEQWLAWREKIAKGCDQIAAMLARSDTDALLSQDNWEQLEATFANKHFDRLELHYSRFRDEAFPVSLAARRETIELKLPPGLTDVATEFYLDPARRHLLPDGLAAPWDPGWRTLYNNRPHRMGGYHDALQSEPIEDPDFGQMLLMQIATDDAMDWCWGDGGVYFFWIRPEHLEACDFSGVEVWLECH